MNKKDTKIWEKVLTKTNKKKKEEPAFPLWLHDFFTKASQLRKETESESEVPIKRACPPPSLVGWGKAPD